MVLVMLATLFDRQVPEGSRFLVVIVLAIGAGFGAAGMGGDAAAKGKLPIPGASEHPIVVGFTGGIAVFFAVILLRDFIMPPAAAPQSLRMQSLKGTITNTAPERLMVTAMFDGLSVAPDSRLVLLICGDTQCRKVVFRARVDEPRQGSMVVFLREPKQSVHGGQLIVENQSGQLVRSGEVDPIVWSEP